MKKILYIIIALSPFIISAFVLNIQNKIAFNQNYTQKAYVAIEAEGKISVIDTTGRKIVKIINLSDTQDNKFVKYTP